MLSAFSLIVSIEQSSLDEEHREPTSTEPAVFMIGSGPRGLTILLIITLGYPNDALVLVCFLCYSYMELNVGTRWYTCRAYPVYSGIHLVSELAKNTGCDSGEDCYTFELVENKYSV